MAPRLMRWLGMLVVGLALVALWGLPPRSREDWVFARWGEPYVFTPESQAFRPINAEVRRLAAAYKRMVRNDSIIILAQEARSREEGFLADLPEAAFPGSRETLEGAIRDQLRSSGVESPLVPVGTVLMDRRVGDHPEVPQAFSLSTPSELFVSRDSEVPYCFVVVAVGSGTERIKNVVDRLVWRGPDSTRVPNPLGPCLLHAKYGSPGTGTFRWLRSGGYGFADHSHSSWTPYEVPSTNPVGRRFGVRFFRVFSPEGAACASGNRTACRDLVLGEKGGERGAQASASEVWGSVPMPVVFETGWGWTGMGFGGAGVRILFDLEEEFGEERFARFWRSDPDVEEAFRAAFGESMEDWVLGWARARWGHLDVSPGIPLSATFLSVLSIGSFIGLALYMGRRRA